MSFTITNFLDDIALYQNLTRLPGETNEAFTSRIKDFATVKYGTDYKTQLQSVSLQAGLKRYPIIEFTCSDPYEIIISPEFITFSSFYDLSEKYGEVKNYFRVFLSDFDIWKTNLLAINQVNNNASIEVIDTSSINGNYLFRNQNTEMVYDIITSKRTRLLKGNIIPGSFRSDNALACSNRVSSIQDIKKIGDYFLDDKIGYLEMFFDDIQNSFHVEYKVYDKIFIMFKTDISLQSIEEFIKYGLNDKFIDMLPQLLYNRSVGE